MISVKSDKIILRGQDLHLDLSHCGQCTCNSIIFLGSGSYTINYTQIWSRVWAEMEKWQLMVLLLSLQELIQEQVEVSCSLLLKLTIITQSLLHEPKAVC